MLTSSNVYNTGLALSLMAIFFGIYFIICSLITRRQHREMEEQMRKLFSGNSEAEDALEIAFNNDVLPILPVDIPAKKG